MYNQIYKKNRNFSKHPGQIYMTKLTSLIVFRLLHDDDIEEFYIGTDEDELESFDDISIRLKVKGFEKPIAVFMQVKLAGNQDTAHAFNITELAKNFESYIKIRNKFKIGTDALLNAPLQDMECAFVLYTNKPDVFINKKYKRNKLLRKLATGDDAFQVVMDDEKIKLSDTLIKNDIKRLGLILARFIRGKNEQLMLEQLIQTYHVILAQKVICIVDSESHEHNIGQFKEDFFDTADENLLLMKDIIFSEVIKDNKPPEEEISDLLLKLLSAPSEYTLSKVIGGVIDYTNNELTFVYRKQPAALKFESYLKKIQVQEAVVKRAIEISARSMVQRAKITLPKAFGNNDLTVRGSEKRIKRRLQYMSAKILELLVKSNEIHIHGEKYNIVAIDDSFKDQGLLLINGGLAGAVGNLLVVDETTELLMFSNRDDLKDKPLAICLFDDIVGEIGDGALKKYRFDIKLTNFPKLSFRCTEHEKKLVDDFMNNIICYTNQATGNDLENKLKAEIAQLLNISEECNFQIKTEAIYLKYYDNILKWRMIERGAMYLTKKSDIFKSTTKYVWSPLLTISNIFNKNEFINKDIKYTTQVINSLNLDQTQSKVIVIISKVLKLSVIKVIQYFEDTKYILIDLNYILNLNTNDYNKLVLEMARGTDEIIILIWNSRLHGRNINDLFKTLHERKLIVVTNNDKVNEIKPCVLHTKIHFIMDEKIALGDFTETSQDVILYGIVMFQDELVRLSKLLDTDAKALIEGEHINILMNGERIKIGGSLNNPAYESIKENYIHRKVLKQSPHERELRTLNRPSTRDRRKPLQHLDTLYDIDNHSVLIIGEPGMGKSCLITHLSLKTKKRDPGVWIVRINLVEYSRCYYEWKKNKVKINELEALRFICIGVVNQKETGFMNGRKIILKENNGEFYLNDCTELNDSIKFELNMFLYFCNRREVMFLFDGFDEVCPLYKAEAIALITVLKSYRSNAHRVWVTSRQYNDVLKDLERKFHYSYELNPLNGSERCKLYRYSFLEGNSFQAEDEHILAWNRMGYFLNDAIVNRKFGPAVGWLNKILPVPGPSGYAKVKKRRPSSLRMMFSQWRNLTYDLYTTPLQIILLANYFDNVVLSNDEHLRWDKIIATHPIQEYFMETLLKIYFEDKNKMDVDIPTVQLIYERTRQQTVEKYKKLAAYATFNNFDHELFNETDIKDIKDSIKSIKEGKDKTGIVCDVINDVPRFIDNTIFGDYFAAEYICDLLKADNSDNRLTFLWDFILNKMLMETQLGVLHIFDEKLAVDEAFHTLIDHERNKRIILDLLLKHSINSPIRIAMCSKMRNWMKLFISTIDYVNSDTLNAFIRMVVNTNILEFGFIKERNEIINAILDKVRNINESLLHELFTHITFPVNTSDSNDDIIRKLGAKFRSSVSLQYYDSNSDSNSDVDTKSDSDSDLGTEFTGPMSYDSKKIFFKKLSQMKK